MNFPLNDCPYTIIEPSFPLDELDGARKVI